MASYTKPNERLSEEQLIALVTAAAPPYAYRGGPREWTWTRPTGVWHLNLTFNGLSVTAHRDCHDGVLQVCVRTTRREIDAALRFLVLVDAIDRHPDDAQVAAKSS